MTRQDGTTYHDAGCDQFKRRKLKTALRWKIPAVQRDRIQMVLLREIGMTQTRDRGGNGCFVEHGEPRPHGYDGGGIKALKPKPVGGRQRENMTLTEEKALLACFGKGRRGGRDVERPRSQGGL